MPANFHFLERSSVPSAFFTSSESCASLINFFSSFLFLAYAEYCLLSVFNWKVLSMWGRTSSLPKISSRNVTM